MQKIKSLNNREIYILKGDIGFKILEGEIEAVGRRFHKEDEDFIPAGKSIPIEIIKDSKIAFTNYSDDKLIKIEARTIPEEWDELVERIKREKDTRIIIFGEMDTGKSFFATYIANKLIESGQRVGVIDTDIGQSDIGPPTTMGFALLEKPILFLHKAKVHHIEFVGSLSPALHFIPTIISFAKITKRAVSESDITIVNTNGWVHGDGGRALKIAKIDIFEPDIIVLLQREDECEPLVKTVFPQSRVVRLKVSKQVSNTSKMEREKLRNLVSQKYFENSKTLILDFDEFETERCYFKTGKIIDDIPQDIKKNVLYIEKFPTFEGTLVVSEKRLTLDEINILNSHNFYNIKNIIKGREKGIIAGLLNPEKEVLALGIIKEIDYLHRKLSLITPYNGDKSNIKIIQFGSLRYTEDGRENGFVEPGYF